MRTCKVMNFPEAAAAKLCSQAVAMSFHSQHPGLSGYAQVVAFAAVSFLDRYLHALLGAVSLDQMQVGLRKTCPWSLDMTL